MKTVTSKKTREALDIAKRILYSFQVLLVGLFIPFLFVFGITYTRHGETAKSGINMSQPMQVNMNTRTADLAPILPDQNS